MKKIFEKFSDINEIDKGTESLSDLAEYALKTYSHIEFARNLLTFKAPQKRAFCEKFNNFYERANKKYGLDYNDIYSMKSKLWYAINVKLDDVKLNRPQKAEVKKWCGIEGISVPDRERIIQIAFCLRLDSKKTDGLLRAGGKEGINSLKISDIVCSFYLDFFADSDSSGDEKLIIVRKMLNLYLQKSFNARKGKDARFFRKKVDGIVVQKFAYAGKLDSEFVDEKGMGRNDYSSELLCRCVELENELHNMIKQKDERLLDRFISKNLNILSEKNDVKIIRIIDAVLDDGAYRHNMYEIRNDDLKFSMELKNKLSRPEVISVATKEAGKSKPYGAFVKIFKGNNTTYSKKENALKYLWTYYTCGEIKRSGRTVLANILHGRKDGNCWREYSSGIASAPYYYFYSLTGKEDSPDSLITAVNDDSLFSYIMKYAVEYRSALLEKISNGSKEGKMQLEKSFPFVKLITVIQSDILQCFVDNYNDTKSAIREKIDCNLCGDTKDRQDTKKLIKKLIKERERGSGDPDRELARVLYSQGYFIIPAYYDKSLGMIVSVKPEKEDNAINKV